MKEKVVSRSEVARQVAEKLRKGYRPVVLHRPTVDIVDEKGAPLPEAERGPSWNRKSHSLSNGSSPRRERIYSRTWRCPLRR